MWCSPPVHDVVDQIVIHFAGFVEGRRTGNKSQAAFVRYEKKLDSGRNI